MTQIVIFLPLLLAIGAIAVSSYLSALIFSSLDWARRMSTKDAEALAVQKQITPHRLMNSIAGWCVTASIVFMAWWSWKVNGTVSAVITVIGMIFIPQMLRKFWFNRTNAEIFAFLRARYNSDFEAYKRGDSAAKDDAMRVQSWVDRAAQSVPAARNLFGPNINASRWEHQALNA